MRDNDLRYDVRLKPQALKDLRKLPLDIKQRIMIKIQTLQSGPEGNVQRLTQFRPAYRLRVGNYRVLFEIEARAVVIYRVLHRKQAYR